MINVRFYSNQQRENNFYALNVRKMAINHKIWNKIKEEIEGNSEEWQEYIRYMEEPIKPFYKAMMKKKLGEIKK